MALCGLLLTGVGCSGRYAAPEAEIEVAIIEQCEGHHSIGGKRYNFEADIFDALSERTGREFNLSGGYSLDSLTEALYGGHTDIAVVPAHLRLALHNFPSHRLYTTRYAVVTRTHTAQASLEGLCRGHNMGCSAGFALTNSFGMVANVAKRVDSTFACGHDAVRQLLGRQLDAIICSMSEAKLIAATYKNLHIAHTIDERVDMILIFRNNATKKLLLNTLEEFLYCDEYHLLRELYIGSIATEEHFPALGYRPTRVVDGISIWDQTIRSSAEKVGVDWRLMSAMAYHETRFRNTLTSSVGAQGLMQVMPVVAEEFNMPDADLFDPTINTLLAAKLLASSSRALGFGTFPDTLDGIAIVVASYHCGITRTLEAQRLAERFGRDPNKWEDIKLTMAEMGNPTSYIRSESRMGLFRNHSVTATYTEGVMRLYKGYCKAIS